MEKENRKVLISIKVSTLLLILISIIAIVVVGNIIFDKIAESKTIANVDNKEIIQSDEIDQENINEEKNTTEEIRTIKAEITSRFQDESREELNLQGTVGTINIEHSLQEKIELLELPQTTPIEEVTISKDMDLTVRTGLSREDFITLIAGVKEDTSGFFEENAGLIYDLCEKYQINEIFFCGLIAGESGWKIANNHRRTYNYISLMSNGGLIRYSSVEEGLEKAAMTLHNNYLTEGGRFYHGPTLAGVKTRFCPASSTWVNLIYGNMKRILN